MEWNERRQAHWHSVSEEYINLFLDAEDQRKVQTARQLLERMGFSMPLEALVEADGSNLSPGERKKLILARALLKEAPFLILDEPWNHLDQTGKEAVQEFLSRQNRGYIIISHQMDALEAKEEEVIALKSSREETCSIFLFPKFLLTKWEINDTVITEIAVETAGRVQGRGKDETTWKNTSFIWIMQRRHR